MFTHSIARQRLLRGVQRWHGHLRPDHALAISDPRLDPRSRAGQYVTRNTNYDQFMFLFTRGTTVAAVRVGTERITTTINRSALAVVCSVKEIVKMPFESSESRHKIRAQKTVSLQLLNSNRPLPRPMLGVGSTYVQLAL